MRRGGKFKLCKYFLDNKNINICEHLNVENESNFLENMSNLTPSPRNCARANDSNPALMLHKNEMQKWRPI